MSSPPTSPKMNGPPAGSFSAFSFLNTPTSSSDSAQPNIASPSEFPSLPPTTPLSFPSLPASTSPKEQARIHYREQQELDRMFLQLKELVCWSDRTEAMFRRAGCWGSEREFVRDQIQVLERCGFTRIPSARPGMSERMRSGASASSDESGS